MNETADIRTLGRHHSVREQKQSLEWKQRPLLRSRKQKLTAVTWSSRTAKAAKGCCNKKSEVRWLRRRKIAIERIRIEQRNAFVLASFRGHRGWAPAAARLERDTAEVADQERPIKQKANGCAQEVDQEKAQKVKSRRGRD